MLAELFPNFSYHPKINLTDQFGSKSFGGFDGDRSLLRCTRIRSENDGAPDYSCNRADHSHRIKPNCPKCEGQQPEIAPNRPDTVSHLASVRHTTVSMTNPADRVEIITSVQRRRRWTASAKVRIVEETFEPGMTVSLVARRHGVAPNQLFTWRLRH